MIALNSMAPPEHTKFLVDLVTLLSDPAATKGRIAEFHEASAELRAAHERLQATQASFTEAENQHKAKLAAATAEHEAAISQARQQFDQERLTAQNAAAARQKRQAEAEAKLRAAEEANAALRAELDKRLALIRAASAA